MIPRPNPLHTLWQAFVLAIKQLTVVFAWAAAAIFVVFGMQYQLLVLFPFALLFAWFGMSISYSLHNEELARIQSLEDEDDKDSEEPPGSV